MNCDRWTSFCLLTPMLRTRKLSAALVIVLFRDCSCSDFLASDPHCQALLHLIAFARRMCSSSIPLVAICSWEPTTFSLGQLRLRSNFCPLDSPPPVILYIQRRRVLNVAGYYIHACPSTCLHNRNMVKSSNHHILSSPNSHGMPR